MKILIWFLFFFSVSAFALGPIPNGTYEGKLTCQSSKTASFDEPGKIVIGDDTMENISAAGSNIKQFMITNGQNFQVNPSKENGSGYFTDDGLFYSITINGLSGEDRFRYLDNTLYLLGSVVVEKDMYLCTGIYKSI